MTKYIVAHDLGTSGNKASLFTTDGQTVKSMVASYGTNFFNATSVEQNPNDWWKAVCDSSKQLLMGIDPKAVVAVSFSGQMMGCLCVDKNGVPLREHIIWADMRSVQEEREIRSKMDGNAFYHLTGHRISASYSLAKLMWVRNNQPDIFKKTYKILNAKDYIVYIMTGKMLTDFSDASGTNAFDLNKYEWSSEILDAVGIDPALFPEAVESVHVAGEMLPEAAEACGMAAGTPVVMGAGDGTAACVGAGSVQEGKYYNCLGSSSWISSTTKQPLYDDQMRTFNWAHMIKGIVSPCGTMQSAGASYEWALKELYAGEADKKALYKKINEIIGTVPAGANGLYFLPYLLGERSPRWNASARGAYVGLKMEHSRDEMMKSTVEGVCMNLRLIFDVLAQRGQVKEITAIGGLAKSASFMQVLTDVLGVETVLLDHNEEASSIGAAIAGGVGVGELKGLESVYDFIKPAGRYYPDPVNVRKYEEMLGVFDRMYKALVPIYDEIDQ